MKRTGFLKRGKGLTRSSPIKRSRKPLKAVNRARQSKREAEYLAYLKSPEWRAKRAAKLESVGHQCEYIETQRVGGMAVGARCGAWHDLQVHHKKYPKVLGEEPLSDLEALCDPHHQFVEATQFWWRRRRRSA